MSFQDILPWCQVATDRKSNKAKIKNSYEMRQKRINVKTRASPRSDEPKQGKDIKTEKIRIATWNIGTLTGRSKELAEILQKRRINICCLQELKWKGAKAREIGEGFKLVYNGFDARNGVGIVLDKRMQENLVHIERINDRLMFVKIVLEKHIYNIISAYAPQTGCDEQTKLEFFETLEDTLQSLPPNESTILCGDLNGHVGKTNTLQNPSHGGFGYGQSNEQGEWIMDLATAYDMKIINTCFKKKDEHLITYKSGGRRSQIDYILSCRRLISKFSDCKIIPGESLTSQHRILVASLKIKASSQQTNVRLHPVKTKWHNIHKNGGTVFLQYFQQNNVLEEIQDEPLENQWCRFKDVANHLANEHLGVTKSRSFGNKETWWWNNDVQEALKDKKLAFKKWQKTKTTEDHIAYKLKSKLSKKAVASAKNRAYDDFYDHLETVEGINNIFKIAKSRNATTSDPISTRFIRNKNDELITSNSEANARWKEYYDELMNEEFNQVNPLALPPVNGPINHVSMEEVRAAVRGMKNNKSVGPDNIPADLWKKLGSSGEIFLQNMFNKMMNGDKMPDEWRNSYLVPIYKNKGNVQYCDNYRGIKLMSHTMKIWERVIENRLRGIILLTDNQCGFVKEKSTTDAIQALRIMVEKFRENKEDLHIAFLDLEKAFDRLPRVIIWQSLRHHKVPEQLINIIKDMYSNTTTQVKSSCGVSEKFDVKVGVHQGSALSPLLFITALDYLTHEIQDETPWTCMYADDIALVSETLDELQLKMNRWAEKLENNGLRISRKKTEYMLLPFSQTSAMGPQNTIKIGETPVPTTSSFRYLGSIINANGKIDDDVQNRVNAGWMKWRSVTGVLCDKKIPPKLKGKIYKASIRPALLYGAECWAANKAHEQKLHVAEMKMLRWSAGVTRRDKVRNDHIRGTFKVADIREKLCEKRLRWYGHVMRRPDENIVKKTLNIPVPARQPGRPAATWLSTVNRDMKAARLGTTTAQDRCSWRLRTRRADPK